VVEIKVKGSNQIFRTREDLAKGHPRKPMSWEELCEKFADCMGHAAKPVSAETTNNVIGMLADLEEVEDVGEIVRLLG